MDHVPETWVLEVYPKVIHFQ